MLIYFKQKARLYYAGKSRNIGFSREKAALAKEIAREELSASTVQSPFDLEAVEAAFKSAQEAAHEALGVQDPAKVYS